MNDAMDRDRTPAGAPVLTLRSSYFAETKACEVFDAKGQRLGFLVVTNRSKGILLSTFTDYEVTHS
jgi:hypothetical protein